MTSGSVILRAVPSPEGSGVVPRVSNPGPSLRSGRQSKVLRVAQDDEQPEAGPWNDVILRSGATKNLDLTLKALKP